MKTLLIIAAGALSASTALAAPPKASLQLIETGRHLVQDIGLCADCHTARGPDGAFVAGKDLQGAPLGFKPLMDMPWSPAAPWIAGLPTMDDKEAITFLTTGVRPSGVPVLPPMPAYRFTANEAKAIVAYLRTLPTPEAADRAAATAARR